MLSKTGGRTELADKLFELLTAIGVAAKHIEARKAGTEQDVVSCIGHFR